jgi:polyisoprenoid-binding protein YceI
MEKSTWAIDPTHSEIGFKVKHMMFTNVSGKFLKFDATAQTEGDNFESAEIRFTGDASSIETGNADRDNHLRSGDFFDIENNPNLEFVSTSFTNKGGDNYELQGNLTLRGVTKPVTLDVEFGGIGQDPWGNTKAGFSAKGKISRKDWGLNWNSALEAGGVLVSDEVRLELELQFVKQ